jgi:hexosaminidase
MNNTFLLSTDCGSIQPGLHALAEHVPQYFANTGKEIQFEEDPASRGFCITAHADRIQIRYSRPCDAFRALGVLLSIDDLKVGDSLAQSSAFDSVGVMLDVSRNGVLTVEAIKTLFCKFALMGINSVQLYMEDTFQLPGEEFFGYFRGGYSPAELRAIDDMGTELGIEVIPCIQTLGHLEQMLQWPAYSDMTDVRGVLLAEEPATFELIEKFLALAASCFRTKKIHIGMDEAHGVGSGNFLRKHGWHRPFDILNKHLERVTSLCAERGLEPMMWSDMYFRIGSATNDYYDTESIIPPEVVSRMSSSVQLVYWDYYHADPEFYKEWIRRHRAMGKEPIFAAGAWTWGRFWAHSARWIESISAGMNAARAEGLKAAFLTVWGDDGSECHPFSTLPAVQYFAGWAYQGDPNPDDLKRQFAVLSPSTSLADCHLAAQIDELPSTRGLIQAEANLSKWLLWHDPILGFLNSHLSAEVSDYFHALASELAARAAIQGSQLRLPAALSRTVAFKSEIHLKLRPAFHSKDQLTLQDLLHRVLPATLDALDNLQEEHHSIWHAWFKPFGWEVLDRRYGGTRQRLHSLAGLLTKKLADPTFEIPELEPSPCDIFPRQNPEKIYFNYSRAATPSTII